MGLAAGCLAGALFLAGASAAPVMDKAAALRDGVTRVPSLRPGTAYSFLFSLDSTRGLGADGRVEVRLAQGSETLVSKTLHAGDADLFATFGVKSGVPARVEIRVHGRVAGPVRYRLKIHDLGRAANIEREPNNRWQDANPVALNSTVFGSADDEPYIPLPGARPKQIMERESGADWFRFRFDSASPKLVFFFIDLMERDNIPTDVSVYRVEGGKAVAFNDGEDPVTLPHEVQALPGNKFTTRILKERGEYYIRVRANHPEYKLRTRVYDPPPYGDPAEAVRTAADYLLGAGDSWHANTPRRGGVFDRVSNVHQETSLCVACHPTHFTQRGALYAAANGYPVRMRQQLQFLSERFYNNPRPFYGFEKQGAVWARVISAPANVLSRMSVLMTLFENEVSGAGHERFHGGIAEYLKLYYKGREKLPNDETNGNTPLVSAYEVAWYSWKVTGEERIARLIDQDEIKNLVDLCYQTLALAEIDRVRYAEKLRRNAERILALQRASGQWSMRFDESQPEVEFQTGHCLWALHAAGIPKEHPRAAKAIRYLLQRQQPFGGWMDPKQSFENFRTPFRETQMAVLALSSYYPAPKREKGWNTAAPSQFSNDPAEFIAQADGVWDAPPKKRLDEVAAAAASPEPLVRQAALEAIGRLAPERYAVDIQRGLGDESKLVQRTAAWALRQAFNRSAEMSAGVLTAALDSDDRSRWGATRVFATHASSLAVRPELTRALARLSADPAIAVRMQALKGLWQNWYWSADEDAKSLIEDTFLAALAQLQHPWVERNLREGIYNLADENIRYFYNNWVPLLADPADRRRVIEGRLAVEARLAAKFARTLEAGSGLQRKRLLESLADLELRRGDVYDLEADLGKVNPVTFSRIGNDIEQIVFFGESNNRMARAIAALLDSPDAEIRRLATRAATVVRDATYPGVNEVAGSKGAGQQEVIRALKAQQPPPADVLKAMGLGPKPAERTGESRGSAAKYGKPDEAFFRAYVEPILQTRGRDGFACIHCHASHTLFNATLSTVMNVVDLNEPDKSLLLVKPTSSAESEGVAGSKKTPHGGGVRWEKGSAEYQAILDWIKGAK